MTNIQLNNRWTLWHHASTNHDWSINGFRKVGQVDTVADFLALMDSISDVGDGWYYLMKGEGRPFWEDYHGGIHIVPIEGEKTRRDQWLDLCISAITETLEGDSSKVAGVSILPDRHSMHENLAYMKIWYA